MPNNTWYQEEDDSSDDIIVREYDITATPNDFNVRTIYDFIESGLVKIPGFQRHYVWDIKRASRLIESLIIGLPIPQIFLYEEDRNSFQVIDGQQRLMSIYYFKKQRFPRSDKRPALRKVFEKHGKIPDDLLLDDELFESFRLHLSSPLPNYVNKFHRLTYSSLGDYQTTFDLRTIRNVVIRQTAPGDDGDSSVYEIFNRLNSGGVNLTPQEIRLSLYHSDFYTMLDRINGRERWRQLLGLPEPDLHTKDLEVLLRGFAMLAFAGEYRPSMTKFLNSSSRKFKQFKAETIAFSESLFDAFLDSCSQLDERAFMGKSTGRFNISTFEAVFVAACSTPFSSKSTCVPVVEADKLEQLRLDSEFIDATQKTTASTENVRRRRKRAAEILFGVP